MKNIGMFVYCLMFLQQNQLNSDEFNIICGLSSWATCGTGLSREYRKTLKNEEINVFGQTVK